MKKKYFTVDNLYKSYLVFAGCLALYFFVFYFVNFGNILFNIIIPLIFTVITSIKILDNEKKTDTKTKVKKRS